MSAVNVEVFAVRLRISTTPSSAAIHVEM